MPDQAEARLLPWATGPSLNVMHCFVFTVFVFIYEILFLESTTCVFLLHRSVILYKINLYE